MDTPCVQVCIINPETKLCEGCGRTIDEIARWASMTDEERRRIMALLRRRMAEAEMES